ncbi:MAG TPA: glycosyltransferase, partial [Acidimicrobiales bacterium]|nr:glycosyltransferase [Acidimicrobiales bacterium]
RSLAPGVEIVSTGRNLGFGPGANVGLRRWLEAGTSEWAAVAPHDGAPQPGCLQRLLAEVSSRSEVGLVSAEFGAGYEYLPVFDKVLGAFYLPRAAGDGWEETDYAHGTLLLARRAALEQVGLFDERYFAYCEEADLGIRARRAGWKVGIVWGAVVTNQELPSGPVADYLQVRNTLLLIKEAHGAYFAGWRSALALAHLAMTAARDPATAPARVRLHGGAVVDFWRGRFGAPPSWVSGLAASVP